MSTLTTKLGLTKPDLSDNGRQTILDLAENFQRLDDASINYIASTPTVGFHAKNTTYQYQGDLNIGDHVGLINLRAGKAAPKWQSLTSYTIGDEILPSVNNGHYYTCIQSGFSSPFEPIWLVTTNSTTEDTKDKSTWQPSTLYELYDIVVPSIDNDRFYVCTVSGTSGASEPTWSTTNGVSTSDNGVVWMTYRIVKWQESGASAYFRPYGKIE